MKIGDSFLFDLLVDQYCRRRADQCTVYHANNNCQPGVVYIGRDDNLYKIGTTKRFENVNSRLLDANRKTGLAFRLFYAVHCNCGYGLEKVFHWKFARYHELFEVFNLPPEAIEFITQFTEFNGGIVRPIYD